MGKYRGSDGWLYDDGVDPPRRYSHQDSIQGQGRRPSEPETSYEECPNCGLAVSWLRVEQRCERCGWGKPKADGHTAIACLALLGISIALPLIGTGLGFALWGFGGALIGLGVTLASLFGFMAFCIAAANKGSSRPVDE